MKKIFLAAALCGAVSAQEPDTGTLPYVSEFTEYIVVLPHQDQSLVGARVTHDIGKHARLVYEYVDRAPLNPGRPGTYVYSVYAPQDLGVFVGASGVTAPWLTVQSCTSSSCSEPNALCSGWCSGSKWICVCTTFGGGNGSGATADRHLRRVNATQKVWPEN